MRHSVTWRIILFIAALLFSQVLVFKNSNAASADKRSAEFESYLNFQTRIKDYQESLKTYTQKIQQRPYDPVAYYNRAMVYSALAMYDKAIADYDKAISLRPIALQPYIGKLGALYAAGKIQETLEVANYVLANFNDHPWGYYWRGRAYLAKGQSSKAIGDLKRFLEKEDNAERIADICYFLGSAYFEMGEFNEAISQLNMAIVKDPLNFEIWILRGLVYKNKLEYLLALRDLRRGLQISGNTSLLAYNTIAWILATCPDPQFRNGAEAVEMAKKAVDLDNSKPYYHDTLAAAYAESGMFKEAVVEQNKALKLLENVPDSQRNEIATRYKRRLESYMEKKPYRDVEE